MHDRCGPTRSPSGPRAYLIEINARVAGGSLVVDWIYHERFHRASTIDALGRQFVAELRDLIAWSERGETQTAIPTDFPLANLDEGELARLARLLGRSEGKGG